ncbi:MAG TPA: flagellar motor protein MotB [Bryobacteraceae bacterium]|nr:flagellar motor protein MotB [Bryobacteraceae bacterium]
MARKKSAHQDHENHERWLVSYADFITLLFAFFVVMFASSQTDKAKAKQVADSVKEAIEDGGIKATVKEVLGGTVDEKGKGNAQFKGPGGVNKMKNPPKVEEEQEPKPKPGQQAELLPSLHYLNKELEDAIKAGKIDVHLEPRGLVISLRQAAFFPSGEDTIAPETYTTIQKIAEVIGRLPNPVRLEGHTDSIPIHTARFDSNWELSAKRAIAMMKQLTDSFGLPKDRFAIAGYAETAPVDSNDTPEGRAHNRRVDIVILNQEALINEPGKLAGKPAPDSRKPSPVASAPKTSPAASAARN